MDQTSTLTILVGSLVTGCSAGATPASYPQCLVAAAALAPAVTIRASGNAQPSTGAKPIPPELCEGLAVLAEEKWLAANELLSTAIEKTAPSERWMVQGFKARAMGKLGQADGALQLLDEAIAGAAGETHREMKVSFLSHRAAIQLARREFGPAMSSAQSAVSEAGNVKSAARANYQAFTIALLSGNMVSTARWYERTREAAIAAENSFVLRNAATLYGQELDRLGRFEQAVDVYDNVLPEMKTFGSKFDEADVMEFYGQSRFGAGDYRGGDRFYGQAAQLYREAGQKEYAEEMERNLRVKLSRFESGSVCYDLSQKGRYREAMRSVTDVAEERRKPSAIICLAEAMASNGDKFAGKRLLLNSESKFTIIHDCRHAQGALNRIGAGEQLECIRDDSWFNPGPVIKTVSPTPPPSPY